MLEQVLPMIQEAAFKEHHRVDVQQDLSRTRRYLGDALLDLWELDAAEQQYEEATKVLETLVKLNPHLPVLRRDLADVYEARAKVSTAKAARSRKREERQRHWTATRAWYQKSHEIWQNWNRHARTGAMDETRREKVRRALERCGEMLAELR
jgi:tetratricopeptide (TPR) repeat protein